MPRITLWLCGVVAMVGCGKEPSIADEDSAPAVPYEDRYPTEVRPPKGTKYPCPLAALPRSLDGIPPSHKGYINHAYAIILSAIHDRLKAHFSLWVNHRPALNEYLRASRETEAAFRNEAAPKSLEPFKADVLAALALQREFYPEAYDRRARGQEPEAACESTPQGRQGSALLQAAWARMQARYPNMSAEVRDSIMHHLCALDVY